MYCVDRDQAWLTSLVIQETNDYGLISYGPKPADGATGANIVAGYTRAGTPTPVNPDFENLKSQWATLNPTGVSSAAYSPSLTPPACPSSTAGLWNVNGNVALPTVGQVFESASPSSQAAGTGASSGSSTQQTGSSASDSSPSASETKSSSASMGKRDMAESNYFRLLVQTGIGLAAMAVVAGLL